MNQLKKISSLFLIVFLFSTCLDEIALDAPVSPSILTVGGSIYSAPGPYSIFLTESAQFTAGAAGIPDLVSGAVIKIMDDQGIEETLVETEPGEYQTAIDGIRGTIGRSYQIEIELNGKTYLSEPETMLPVVSAESLEVDVAMREQLNEAGNFVTSTAITVMVNTDFPEGDDGTFLKWSTFGEYEYAEIGTQGNLNPQVCYITENIDFDNVVVASSEKVAGDFLQQQPVLTRVVDYRFTARYCFHVVQQSITKNAYNFWSAVGEEFERSGNIFETPPGKIKGNIYNKTDDQEEVLGFFSASAVDTITILVQGKEVGNPAPQCRPFPRGPETCTNCLLINNSTRTKPTCWD